MHLFTVVHLTDHQPHQLDRDGLSRLGKEALRQCIIPSQPVEENLMSEVSLAGAIAAFPAIFTGQFVASTIIRPVAAAAFALAPLTASQHYPVWAELAP